jgi:hypothetical protein
MPQSKRASTLTGRAKLNTLYPRLPLYVSTQLAYECGRSSIEQLAKDSRTEHDAVWFAPTGGNRVRKEQLSELRSKILDCAKANGYPAETSNDQVRKFDDQCGVILLENLHMSPSEASHLEVWTFFCIILLPDIVRWRFPGSPTPPSRFIGSDRGLRRNTFGRLWWRTFLLHDLDRHDPYELVFRLSEDELVQITERPSIAANPRLARMFAERYLHLTNSQAELVKRDVMRDTAKRLRRLLPLLSFDALDSTDLVSVLDELFTATTATLVREPAVS